MRHATRPEGHPARRRLEHEIAGLEAELALEHIPQLIFAEVVVQGRTVSPSLLWIAKGEIDPDMVNTIPEAA